MAVKKKINKEDYRLCYVDGALMYFTDNFENQWGDDWNDSPYEHNAEPPYMITPNRPEETWDDAGHMVLAAWYDNDYETNTPCENYCNSPYSVQDINAGAVAWLFKRGKGGLMGGATVAEAREFCKKNNILFGVLE